MSIGRKIFNRDSTVKQQPRQGSKKYYQPKSITDKLKEEANICLTCTEMECDGICNYFRKEKKRIWGK